MASATPDHKLNVSQTFQKLLSILSLIGAFCLLYRWWYVIDRNSVNVLFWDQWDLANYLFADLSWRELFAIQHGPHRQGLGFVLSRIIVDWSDWNSRAECFAIGVVMALSAVLALWVKRLIVKRFHWSDWVVAALIFTSPMHWELFAMTPNLSHGSVPLVLLMAYCCAWFIPNEFLRYPLVLIFNYLAVWTGFGVFLGLVTPFLFVALFIQRRSFRWMNGIWRGLMFVLSVLSMVSFFDNYLFVSSGPQFKFPMDLWWIEYPRFIVCLLASFCGMKLQSVGIVWASVVGGLFFLLMVAVVCQQLWILIREFRYGHEFSFHELIGNKVILACVCFSLIFVINTAIGRAPEGILASQASRYLAYIIPGAWGVYTCLLQILGKTKAMLPTTGIVVILLLLSSVPIRSHDRITMERFAEIKRTWVRVYLETQDIQAADEAAGFVLYPNPEATDLEGKLQKLKEAKQNLFIE